MPPKKLKPLTRKPRTDAERNRQRILAVAKDAFTRHGANASLDDIAKEAEVGPGTLYRHFPTRDALIRAVYHTEVEILASAAARFSETLAPIEALRSWMMLFVDFIAAKHIIAPALNSITGGPAELYAGSRKQVQGAIDSLLKRAKKSGDVRSEVESFDLFCALVGIANMSSSPDWQKSARRLVNILIAGSLR